MANLSKIKLNDTIYNLKDAAVPEWAKAASKPTYTATEVGALPDDTFIPSKTSDLTNDTEFITGMEFLSYGHSTWAEFLAAYTAKRVVYCRASSNANPASGSQTRLAFMAYINNAENPTEVEFQYYRSVSSHTVSQQGDQVYVYKLNKTNGWSLTVREASVKVAAGTDIDLNYKNGVATLSFSGTIPSTAADVGAIAAPEQPAEGDLLIWDGTTWAPDELTASSIGAIEAPSTPTTGASLIYNGTNWVAQQLTASDVGALPNTTVIPVSSVNGQTGAVVLNAANVGAIAAPSSPANGSFLVWDGTAWVAQTMATWQGGNY